MIQSQLWRMKRFLRQIVPAKVPQVDWRQILGSDFEHWRRLQDQLPANAPKVLLAPSAGGSSLVTLDSLLAVALTLRGARAEVFLCDEALPACQSSVLERIKDEGEFLKHGPQRWVCAICHKPGYRMLSDLGLRVHLLSETVTPDEQAEAERIATTIAAKDIVGFELDGVPLGEHAMAAAVRFYASGTLEREPHGEAVLRKYLRAAIVTARSVARLMDREGFSVASFHHGIYVPQGVIGAIARSKGVRVVNWAMAYRKNSFIFSHGETYHHTMLTEPTDSWKQLDWTPEREQELLTYLKSRWNGAQDWISYNRDPQADREVIGKQLGMDMSKPTIGLLTNVMWDAQLFYPENAFANMLEWLLITMRYFQQRPDLQLVIRIHPAELRAESKSRQPILAELKREFPKWPSNVFVIPPESSISTYAVMMECDAVLLYGTKTGVELTSFGVPVIAAGEAWIRNKGLTIDVKSKQHYKEVLDSLPLGKRMTAEQKREAQKYAYHFFFRRMIPLRSTKPVPPPAWMMYSIAARSLDDLRPGRDPGLDLICDGILKQAEFVYPAEKIAWPEPEGAHSFSVLAQ